MELVLGFIICLIGSMIQGAMGFGYAIFCMALLPLFIPFKVAAAVVLLSSFMMLIQMVYRLRDHINIKLMFWPTVFSFAGSTVGIYILMHYPEALLKMILGLVLVLLSVYLAFYNQKIKMKASVKNGMIAGLISGISGGISNIDGPPLVIYYFSAASDKMEYHATIQSTFLIGGIYSILLHISYGNINERVLELAGAAVVAVLLGSYIGLKIFAKLKRHMLNKLIYFFMAVMGMILMLK